MSGGGRRWLPGATLLLALIGPACRQQPAPAATTAPTRIVCGAPSASEICCALGLIERVVGRTRYCTYPPALAGVESIGDLVNVNAEQILALRPDLIFIAGNSRLMAERLAPLEVRVESLPDGSLADVFHSIRRVGEITQRQEQAALLNEQVRMALDAAVAPRSANHRALRVLIVVASLPDPPEPPFAAGAGTLFDDLLKRAGHLNALPDVSGYAPIALESLRARAPDVILEIIGEPTLRPRGDVDALQAWARVGPLPAVQQRRVHVLAGDQYLVPGPRVAETLAAMLRILEPASHAP